MKNKFIYSPTKSLFEKKLAAGEINEGSIVFIEDTKEIWNRGYYFGMVGSGSGIDPEVLSGIETAIATLQSDKADKSELANYAKKNELPSLDGYLTKTVADSLYATIAQYNTLNQTIGNIQTELSSKLTSSDLADYAKTADVPTKISDLTDDSDFITNVEANAAYAPKSLVTTVSDQATTISTLATKDELSTGLAGKLDNSAASGFVPTNRTVNGKALNQNITLTASDLNAATQEQLNGVNTDLQGFKTTVANTYITPGAVDTKIAALVGSVPETLNTLDELAAALGDDPNFATTVSNLIGTKASQDDLDDTNTNVANLTDTLNTKLDKTGGIISGDLQIRRGASQNYITFENANGSPQGYLGFNGNNNPIYISSEANTIYSLLHSGNVGDYAITTKKWLNEEDDVPLNTTGMWTNHGGYLSAGWSESYKMEFLTSTSGIKARTKHGSNDSDWKTIAFTDSNVTGAHSLRNDAGDSVVYIGKTGMFYIGDVIYPNTSTKLIGKNIYLSYGENADTGLILNSSGNVGIGTTTPAYKLDINGAINITDNYKIGGYDVLRVRTDHLAVGEETTAYQNLATHIYGTKVVLRYGTNKDIGFVINSSGNVTIGPSDLATEANGNPKLYVNGKTKLNGEVNILGERGIFQINSSNSYYFYLGHDESSKRVHLFNLQSNSYLALYDDTRIVIGGGNVLIGTTNDSGYKLDVNGSFNATSGYINGNAIIHSGNIGSQSVNYANSAGSANSVAWSNVSGKPTFATVATSGSYNDLSNKPTIPTNTNQLTNGAGFITGITKAMVTTALGYTPPTTNTTYSAATTSANGLMSKSDKSKLDGIASGATAVSSSTVSGWGYTKNTGTVTSVAMTVPTGLSVSGTPITTSGTLALSFASGYSIPTTAKQGNWDTAYGWGNHASAGYVKSSGVTSVATGTGLTGGTITGTGTISINSTYQGYITNGNNAWASHTKLAANKINAIPVTHKVVTCPISAAGSFAISGTMTAGQVIHVIVQNTTTSAIAVTIPNSGSYHSFSGTSLSVPASKYAEINVVYNGEKMFIRTAY